MEIDELKSLYAANKKAVSEREASFAGFLEKSTEKRVFAELAFCLLTPQANAFKCWEAVRNMKKNRVLFTGSAADISPFIACARFKNKKARYIVLARDFFTENGRIAIKKRLALWGAPREAREKLVENIAGMGMKEASHFLRNAGKGAGLAIIDRHILRNLSAMKVIEGIPPSVTRAAYLDIEQRFNGFAADTGIPAGRLDLLLWFRETGFFFK